MQNRTRLNRKIRKTLANLNLTQSICLTKMTPKSGNMNIMLDATYAKRTNLLHMPAAIDW